MTESIYVGDGTWDLRATQALGIPFIGVGEKHAELAAAGAKFVHPTLTPAGIFSLLENIHSSAPSPLL